MSLALSDCFSHAALTLTHLWPVVPAWASEELLASLGARVSAFKGCILVCEIGKVISPLSLCFLICKMGEMIPASQ